jgi:hypothetical protein
LYYVVITSYRVDSKYAGTEDPMAAIRRNRRGAVPAEQSEPLDLSERDLALIVELVDDPPAVTEAFEAAARQVFPPRAQA